MGTCLIKLTNIRGNILTQILSFSGNSLPYALNSATTLAYEDSFIILGGERDSNLGRFSDKIQKYDKDGIQMYDVVTSLSEGKQLLSAMKVNPSIFNTC